MEKKYRIHEKNLQSMNAELIQLNSKEILKTMDNCTKCGICHSYCPVSLATNEFPGPKYTGPQVERFRKLENFDELSPELCNGCGICMSVCPNDVAITDIITLAKSNSSGDNKISFTQKILNRPKLIGKIGNQFPILANFIVHNPIFRLIGQIFFDLSSNAPLPKFKGKEFYKFTKKNKTQFNKDIIYFSGCSVDHFDPNVGISTIKVMNRLKYNVITHDNLCCSLPMLSSGEIKNSEKITRNLIKTIFNSLDNYNNIISTSTSCSLTIKKKYAAYLDFSDHKYNRVSSSMNDICEYLINYHIEDLKKILNPIRKKIFYHGPCQLRSHGMGQPAVELLKLIPGIKVILSEADCCGIGGTYGYTNKNNKISNTITQFLLDQITNDPPDIIVCDSETCRWNIEKNSKIKTIHPIELIAKAILVESK